MERKHARDSENLPDLTRLHSLAAQALHKAILMGYTDPPQGDLFKVLNNITDRVLAPRSGEHRELNELKALLGDIHDLRDRIKTTMPDFRPQVSSDEKGRIFIDEKDVTFRVEPEDHVVLALD